MWMMQIQISWVKIVESSILSKVKANPCEQYRRRQIILRLELIGKSNWRDESNWICNWIYWKHLFIQWKFVEFPPIPIMNNICWNTMKKLLFVQKCNNCTVETKYSIREKVKYSIREKVTTCWCKNKWTHGKTKGKAILVNLPNHIPTICCQQMVFLKIYLCKTERNIKKKFIHSDSEKEGNRRHDYDERLFHIFKKYIHQYTFHTNILTLIDFSSQTIWNFNFEKKTKKKKIFSLKEKFGWTLKKSWKVGTFCIFFISVNCISMIDLNVKKISIQTLSSNNIVY